MASKPDCDELLMRLLVQPDVAERFWEKVDKRTSPHGCWLWTAAKYGKGYGKFTLKKNVFVLAHRFAYDLAYGFTPKDQWIVRKPECPTTGCCNPGHLMVGTRSDAMCNGWDRGTVVAPYNPPVINTQERKASRKFTAQQIREIRKLLELGASVATLSQQLGCDRKTIYKIKNRQHYQDIA